MFEVERSATQTWRMLQNIILLILLSIALLHCTSVLLSNLRSNIDCFAKLAGLADLSIFSRSIGAEKRSRAPFGHVVV
jgi:hypothetical protein